MKSLSLLLFFVFLAFSCENGVEIASIDGEEESEAIETSYDEEYGKNVLATSPDDGKGDSASGSGGISTGYDNSSTQVWKVTNQWLDKDTTAAKKAGIAWEANSGLTWYQKYQLWVKNMEEMDSEGGWYTYKTFKMKTPWGKEVPAPSLECAEAAMFLIATFASWYNLPFMMEAYSRGSRLFFGHFGQRYISGTNAGTTYLYQYKDYTSQFASQTSDYIETNWPKDTNLRKKSFADSDSTQPFLGGSLDSCSEDTECSNGEGCHSGKCYLRAGAYFDEIFLNKRVGHFMIRFLDNFGSINLASSKNTHNVKATAIKEGDFILHRYANTGIGHTLPVKMVEELEEGRKNVLLVSGSMPRRQPKWDDANSSKYEIVSDSSGCGEYLPFGGGLKRFRLPKKGGGKWTNAALDPTVFVLENSQAAGARCQEFQELLGNLTPAEKREALLNRIQAQRTNLSGAPSSCMSRERREDAFRELYELNQTEFGISKEQTDKQYRELEDYVFAEMIYDKTITCCWNGTNQAMYEIVMDYNEKRTANNTASMCQEPVVFKAVGGKYEVFKQHALSIGRGAEWKEWSNDENCPLPANNSDQEKVHEWTPFCTVGL